MLAGTSSPMLMMLRTAGRGRLALLTACTAVVSAFLLVAVAILRLPTQPQEALFPLVQDPSTRYGTTFAILLLTVPPLLLLHQAVRLGTAARERRLAAFRLAGATPGQVRSLAAVEVGVPSFIGAAIGIGGYLVLRWTLGGHSTTTADRSVTVQPAALVPTSVAPSWWQVLSVVVAVTVSGVLVGLAVSRRVVVSPLGLVRHELDSRRPRPWRFMLFATAVASAAAALTLIMHWDTQILGVTIVGFAVLEMLSLAPWLTLQLGLIVERRANSVPVLLAARRLIADPRPAGRAASAVGGIALVAGGAAAITAELTAMDHVATFHLGSMLLVALALIAALLPVVGSLTSHSTESLLEHQRSTAALAALGVTVDEVVEAQRWELRLSTLPVATLGVLLGAGALLPRVTLTPTGLLVVIGVVVLMPVLVWLAVQTAVLLTRSLALRVADPTNLRTS